MAEPTQEQKDAINVWSQRSNMFWTRVPTGWKNEVPQQTIQIITNRDVSANPFIVVQPQRRLKSGTNKGAWTSDCARGDIHNEEDFLNVLESLKEAGRRVGWLDQDE